MRRVSRPGVDRDECSECGLSGFEFAGLESGRNEIRDELLKLLSGVRADHVRLLSCRDMARYQQLIKAPESRTIHTVRTNPQKQPLRESRPRCRGALRICLGPRAPWLFLIGSRTWKLRISAFA
jgi:hypothetical protein